MGKKRRQNQELARRDPTDPTAREAGVSSPAERVLQRTFLQQSVFAGPLPSPEALAKFEQVLPGLAERIVKQAEGQTQHRQLLETTVIKGNNRRASLGQYFALFLATLIILEAGYLALHGHDTVAAIIGGADIVSIVAIFVTGRFSEKSERADKRNPPQDRR